MMGKFAQRRLLVAGRQHPWRTPSLAVAAVALLAVTAVGCGGDDETGAAQSGDGKLSGSVKIGLLIATTGPLANEGRAEQRAVETYIDQQGGTLDGMEVELITEDTQADPALTVQKAQKVLDSDAVDVVIGIENSAAALAVRDTFHNRKKIAIVTLSSANSITSDEKSPYIFRTGVSSVQNSGPLGPWAAEDVGKNGVLIANDYTAGRELADGFTNSFEGAGGKVMKSVFVPLGTADFASYITDLRGSGADFVWSALVGADAAKFVQQYGAAGDDAPELIGVGSITTNELLHTEGEAALGVMTNFPYTPTLDNPTNQKYVEDYRAKFDETPSELSVFAYDAIQLVHQALLANGGKTDSDSLSQAMEQVELDSPRGKLSIDPETHGVVQQQYLLKVVQGDGELENDVVESLGFYNDKGEKVPDL